MPSLRNSYKRRIPHGTLTNSYLLCQWCPVYSVAVSHIKRNRSTTQKQSGEKQCFIVQFRSVPLEGSKVPTEEDRDCCCLPVLWDVWDIMEVWWSKKHLTDLSYSVPLFLKCFRDPITYRSPAYSCQTHTHFTSVSKSLTGCDINSLTQASNTHTNIHTQIHTHTNTHELLTNAAPSYKKRH